MRILIADGRSKVRFALRALLERQAGQDVVGEAGRARDLLALVVASQPDLVLLDWELPGLEANCTLENMRGAVPSLCIVALSGRSEARQTALAAGADAFVSKTDPPERLLAALDGCERGIQNTRR